MTVPTDDLSTPPPASRPGAKVGWPELGIAVAVAVVLYGVGILVFTLIPAEQAVAAGLFQYALSGLAPLGGFAAAVLLRRRHVRDFGVRRVSGRWLAIAFAVGLGAIVLNFLLTWLFLLSGDPQNVQGNYQAAATGGIASFLGAIVLGAVLTPVGEELLFRGVLASFLDRWGPWVAVLLSSAVFALAHGINIILPVAFVVGIAAALLLRRTGSVWPGVVVHVCNNAFSVLGPALYAIAA